MGMDRQRLIDMTDTELRVLFDGKVRAIRREWDRGAPGKLSDAYDLALISTEATVRSLRLSPMIPAGWMTLFDAGDPDSWSEGDVDPSGDLRQRRSGAAG